MRIVDVCTLWHVVYALLHFCNSSHLFSAPVIGNVASNALLLSEVQVTVTLSDNGGQPVEEYNVSHVKQ